MDSGMGCIMATKAITGVKKDKASGALCLILAGGRSAVVYYNLDPEVAFMTLVASDISGGNFGLGAFEQGACADGADFVCGPKTSGGVTIDSCRPCDFAQLAIFKELQTLANSMVVALKLDNKPAIVTGRNDCAGGDILAIDGRIGPCTARTISRIIQGPGLAVLAPSDPLLARSNFAPTKEYVAHAAPEVAAYLRQLVAVTNAPRNVPAPAQQPVSKTAGGPGSSSSPIVLPTTTLPAFPSPAARKASGLGLTVGILGALAAVGLVGTGVYYYRSRA